jgi:hypothetical protein
VRLPSVGTVESETDSAHFAETRRPVIHRVLDLQMDRGQMPSKYHFRHMTA